MAIPDRHARDTSGHSRHWTRSTIAIALAACLAAGVETARAESDDDPGDNVGRRFCSATARAQFQSCGYEAKGDFFNARAICINHTNAGTRSECFGAARAKRWEAERLCMDQYSARRQLCGALGEARYDPAFDAADFAADFTNLANPNPWFPLRIGNRWTYRSGDETIMVQVLDETKLVAGVTCIVVRDRVEIDGQPIEDTDDWYGQRNDGTVFYCGESVRNFESFEGDDPPRAELVSIDGSWKAGRDGDRPGIQFMGRPTVGAVYRQEFSAGNAEDAAKVLSATYGHGRDSNLDRFVPEALARLLCADDDCVVTEEFSPLEPGATQRKYYAAGIGLFLDVKPTGELARLVDCNFDSRCAVLSSQ